MVRFCASFLPVAALLVCMVSAAERFPQQADVWVSGTDGYHTYRIPAVIVTTKGTVLAFCEGRKTGRGDSGDIDLLLKRSTDGGHTFSKQQIVWDDGPNTCGNPCPVVDRQSGTIWLLLTHNLGRDVERDIIAQKSKGTRIVWITQSTDDGLTWSKPVEITRDAKKPDWTWYATGPGAGIQLRSGRLVVPCDHIEAGTGLYFSHVIYSDDHGATWKLGGSAGPWTNECEVVELADGSLMLNMRNYDPKKRARAVATSRDGGLSWSAVAHDPVLVEPICQASIRRYCLAQDGGKDRILFSNPAHASARKEMTLRLSCDEGKTWPTSKVLWPGPAAYSCLAVLPDGTILCLYERGEKQAYEKITLARLGLDWLTGAGPLKMTRARFTISIDKTMWERFGFQYPATYVFELGEMGDNVKVSRRDGLEGPWTPLEPRTSADFFNGMPCVRFDREKKRAYVSVGFGKSHTVQLELAGAASAKFLCVARYYDNRKAAYTLSLDNWGCNAWAHPGAPWRGTTDDESDNYQAALHVCRGFRLPASIAINSRSAGGESTWQAMQEELDRQDFSWEPAVHGQTHPKDGAAYQIRGYEQEILGCRQDILSRLRKIPYGPYVFEHILTHGYQDETILRIDGGHFLFIRGFNWLDNHASTDYEPWNKRYGFYGVGGLNTKGYDRWLERREPKGRFFASDVAEANAAFDRASQAGGIFYALWHPDRFRNSILYDPRPGVDGQCGSTLMQHLAYVSGRKDVWYVANGWLYCYRYVAENAHVTGPAQGTTDQHR